MWLQLELVSFADAEPAEYFVQNILTACFAGDFGEMFETFTELEGDKLDGFAALFQKKCTFDIVAYFYENIPVSHIGDKKGVILPGRA